MSSTVSYKEWTAAKNVQSDTGSTTVLLENGNLEIIKLQDLKHITTLPDLSLHMNLQRIFLINTGIDI